MAAFSGVHRSLQGGILTAFTEISIPIQNEKTSNHPRGKGILVFQISFTLHMCLNQHNVYLSRVYFYTIFYFYFSLNSSVNISPFLNP